MQDALSKFDAAAGEIVKSFARSVESQEPPRLACRIGQWQPFDSMLLHDERQYLSIPNPTNSIRICRDSFVGCIKHRNGEFARYRWKLVQKFIKALATFQVIEKGADWGKSGQLRIRRRVTSRSQEIF